MQRIPWISVWLAGVLAFAPVAGAQVVNVNYLGIPAGQSVSTYRDGNFHWSVYAGEMSLTIDGAPTPAYCVDLDNVIASQYLAELQVVPTTEEWCEIAWILENFDAVDSFWSAAIQVAVWKLVELPTLLTVPQADAEDAATWIVEQAEGKCPITCLEEVDLTLTGEAGAGGLIHVTATITEGGSPVYGENVVFTTDQGVITSPPGGVGETDVNGQAFATIDLQGGVSPPTVAAYAEGSWLQQLVPLEPSQQLLAFVWDDPCPFEDEICIDIRTCFDLGPASGWNVFTCGDYIDGLDVLGKAAVGGNAYFRNFSIGIDNQGGDVLVVGGDLDAQHGTIYGNAVYGNNAFVDGTVDFQAGGSLYQGTPIDFVAACDTLMTLAGDLSLVPDNGAATIAIWGAVDLVGTDPDVNVFSLDAADVSGASSLTIDAPAGSKVLVNVSGSSMEFSAMGMTLLGVGREDVLFNLYEATDVTVRWISFQGSMLAPFAAVEFYDGNLEGTLVAYELEGGGELHDYTFDGEICVGTEECERSNCSVAYSIVNEWPGGFQADVQVTYSGDPASSWTAEWDFQGGEQVNNLWNGVWSQSGTGVTVDDAGWNGNIADGSVIGFGFTASGAPGGIDGFTFNGVACD